jgi:HSP20 family protein
MFLVPMTRRSSDLSRVFDRLFDDTFDRLFAVAPAASARAPSLDVSESDQDYTIKLDLPGASKDDVKVSIEGRRVSVEAQASKESEKKDGERIVYRERSASRYARTFALPQEIDEAASSAKLDDGVLTLKLAKREPVKRARITVN